MGSWRRAVLVYYGVVYSSVRAWKYNAMQSRCPGPMSVRVPPVSSGAEQRDAGDVGRWVGKSERRLLHIRSGLLRYSIYHKRQ